MGGRRYEPSEAFGILRCRVLTDRKKLDDSRLLLDISGGYPGRIIYFFWGVGPPTPCAWFSPTDGDTKKAPAELLAHRGVRGGVLR